MGASRAVQGALLYDANGNVLVGQKTMAASVPVALASDQAAVPVAINAAAPLIAVTLVYDETLAVAGAQANLYYLARSYQVPVGYRFVASAFNGWSADNRVAVRVAKTNTLAAFDIGTQSFSGGFAYAAPAFASYLEAEVTTATGGTDVTLTASYTNDAGTAGRTATALVKKNTPVGYKVLFTLQGADLGARSVQSVTRSVATTGAVAIKGGVEFWEQDMTNALTNYITVPSIASMRAAAGEIVELAWASNAAATSERRIKVMGGLEQ